MTSPYSTYTADITVIATEVKNRIDAAKATFRVPVLNVFYGDQDQLPGTPTVCVEPNDKQRELAGAPNMTENTFIIFILIYHDKLQDNQQTRLEVDQIAFDIEHLLHQDLQLTVTGNPLLIHGFVERNESGYVYKKGTLYRTARITYKGMNKTSLPTS